MAEPKKSRIEIDQIGPLRKVYRRRLHLFKQHILFLERGPEQTFLTPSIKGIILNGNEVSLWGEKRLSENDKIEFPGGEFIVTDEVMKGENPIITEPKKPEKPKK